MFLKQDGEVASQQEHKVCALRGGRWSRGAGANLTSTRPIQMILGGAKLELSEWHMIILVRLRGKKQQRRTRKESRSAKVVVGNETG